MLRLIKREALRHLAVSSITVQYSLLRLLVRQLIDTSTLDTYTLYSTGGMQRGEWGNEEEPRVQPRLGEV